MRATPASLLALGLVALLPATLSAQQGNGLPEGVTREQMWYAPTSADWAKPCDIPWQRTWSDATALSKQTKKAILVCVNMDGEIASEHWAGIRYRDPEIAKLFEKYVCVIASTDRHNARDYDDSGNRIACPRFGTVTCGEHIWMEPTVYGMFLDETRVAPRHIMVELDGSETYDIFYANDIQSIVATVTKGIEERTIQPEDPPRGDRSLAELVASPDAADRARVEQNWRDGDRQTRQEILAAAENLGGDAPIDLLREAAYGFDSELSGKALDLLAMSSRDKAVGLIDDLLRGPLEPERRAALLDRLDALSEKIPVAKRLARVHRGLGGDANLLDSEAWAENLEEEGSAFQTGEAAELLAEAIHPDNMASLKSGQARVRRVAEEQFRIARDAAQAEIEAGATDWLPHAIIAISCNFLKEDVRALEASRTAIDLLPIGESSWNAYAVLSTFTDGRREAILKNLEAKKDWPTAWLSEAQSTYAVLIQHPYSTEAEVARHYDFLIRLRANGPAGRALQDGLKRFPDSWILHERFRLLLIAERDIAAVEEAYSNWLIEEEAPKYLRWYAAHASLFVAEQYRRTNRPEKADEAYRRCLDQFAAQRLAAHETSDSAAPYEVLAMAGRARLALERGDVVSAQDLILAAFEHHPDSAAMLDGLRVSPVGTARKVLAALEEAGDTPRAQEVQAALDALGDRDTGLLELPAFDRPVAPK